MMIESSNTLVALLPYILSLALALSLGIYGLTKRKIWGVPYFCAICFSQFLWLGGYLLELLMPSMKAKIFWDNFQWFGTSMVAFSIFALAFYSVNSTLASSKFFWSAAVVSSFCITLLSFGIVPEHLFRQYTTLTGDPPLTILDYNLGPLAVGYGMCLFLMGVAALAIIFRGVFNRNKIMKRRALFLFTGYLIPVGSTILAFLDIRVQGQLDITPFTFGVGNLLIAVGLFRYGIFRVSPVARDKLFEMMQDGFIVLDNEKRVIDINPGASTWIGYGKEILGKSINSTNSKGEDLISRLAQLSRPCREEVNWRAESWAEIICIPLEENSREDRSQLIIIRDISERKKAEKIIATSKEMLEEKIKERTAALRNEISNHLKTQKEKETLSSQLMQAQKMESIGRLAGGMAHDFNNILTAINGFASVALLKLDKRHPMQEYLQEIIKASNRGAELTSHLLAFSRKQVINPEIQNINEICQGLKKILQRLIGEDIRLEMNLGRDLPAVNVDRGQIDQVIINLTVNARDAMPEGGSLFLETASAELDPGYCIRHPEVEPGRYVMFSVRDTGHGIPRKYLDKIFEPFFTSKEIGKGTGLGLAMVYGAINQNGGSIDVLSEEGRGTTFRCYLPESDSVEMTEPISEEQLQSYSGAETIILVEDDPMVGEMAELILTQKGYSVRSFSNPDDTLSFINTPGKKADLLLTDVVLPGMNGVELAEKVKKILPNIKILYSSGYADNRIVTQGSLRPGVNLAMKPWNMSDFLRMVRDILDS